MKEMVDIININWNEYFKIISDLINKILDSDFQPNQVISISRGGLIPGDIISRTLELPLALMSVSSYRRDLISNTDQQGEIIISHNLTTSHQLNSKVLLVDDLTDTGTTLHNSVKWLNRFYHPLVKEIKTAVLWHKETSFFIPDYYSVLVPVNETGKCPWILQPQDALAREIMKLKPK